VKQIIIKNWQTFQHYKDRRPPWIKLHARLIDSVHDNGDAAYNNLSDIAKLHLHHLWLLASRYNDARAEFAVLPYDTKWLQPRLNVASPIASTLPALMAAGFVFDASKFPLYVSEKESLPFDPKPNFLALWPKYPLGLGQRRAFTAYKASVSSPEDAALCAQALDRYLAHLAANPWKSAQNGGNWFAEWREWVDFTEPAPIRNAVGPDGLTKSTDRDSLIYDEAQRIKDELGYGWQRDSCSAEDASAYIEHLRAVGLADAPTLDEWLALRRTA
jgi:hypothetical protein